MKLESAMTDIIERLKTENEQWRKLNSERVDEIAGLIHRLREAATANERLMSEREAMQAAIATLKARSEEYANEIERLRAEIAEWQKVADASTPEDFRLQMKADGERDD